MKLILKSAILMLLSGGAAEADGVTASPDGKTLAIQFGQPTFKQVLHYRKMYEKKPFPDAEIYYYSNGLYKIISQGEDHYGLYVPQGKFGDQSWTVKFISLPSADWGNKTAFHQLTFIQGATENVFIQHAIVDSGEEIPQQNGSWTMVNNEVANPLGTHWHNR